MIVFTKVQSEYLVVMNNWQYYYSCHKYDLVKNKKKYTSLSTTDRYITGQFSYDFLCQFL